MEQLFPIEKFQEIHTEISEFFSKWKAPLACSRLSVVGSEPKKRGEWKKQRERTKARKGKARELYRLAGSISAALSSLIYPQPPQTAADNRAYVLCLNLPSFFLSLVLYCARHQLRRAWSRARRVHHPGGNSHMEQTGMLVFHHLFTFQY